MRRYFYPLLAILFFVTMAVPFFRKTDSQWDNVYLGAAQRLLAGDDLFRLENGYLYPPFMAWLAIPFTHLPTVGARAAWFVINVVAIVTLCILAWKLSGGLNLTSARADWKEHLIFWLGMLAAFRFAIDCLQNQQTDLVIAAVLLVGCFLLTRGQALAAATLFGLAAGMKCTALLWCPYLLWRRQWLPALWVGVVAIGVNLLPNLTTAPASGNWWLAEWVTKYLALLTRPDHAPGVWGSALVLNQSWSGASYRWFMTTWEWTDAGVAITERANALTATGLKVIVYGTSVVAVAASAWVMGWKRGGKASANAGRTFRSVLERIRTDRNVRRTEPWEYSVVLLLMVLLSPMSSKPHFATMSLPAFLLARQAVVHRQVSSALCLGLAIGAGLLSTKDLAGAQLATLIMWLGGVSFAAFAMLVGCWLHLLVAVRPRHVENVPHMLLWRRLHEREQVGDLLQR